MLCRQVENFLRGLFECAHAKLNLTLPLKEIKVDQMHSSSSVSLRQIRHRAGVFDEFLQSCHHFGTRKELAENLNLAPKFFMRKRFHEFLGGCARHRIILCRLRGRGPGNCKSFAFSGKLRHQADGVRASSIYGAARKQQISDDSIAKIAFQSWHAAKTGNESEPQFGEGEARHFVGNNDVAGKSEFEPAAQACAMNRRDGDKRSGVDSVHDRMNALQKAANPL